MAQELITLKATEATVKALRLIAALTEEKQYEALERLVMAEKERLQAPKDPEK